MMRRHGTVYRRADSARNSICGSEKIGRLDFRNWWMDGNWTNPYLHVAGPDGTSHRVFPKIFAGDTSLSLKEGVLYWRLSS